jgi:phosphoglycerol transferase
MNTNSSQFKILLSIIAAIFLLCLYFWISNRVAESTLEPRYEASLYEGIDFSKKGYPNFLKAVHGISAWEDWGRWSDANESEFPNAVDLVFKETLPKKFQIELSSRIFGPNVNKPLEVIVDKRSYFFTHSNPDTSVNLIEITENKGDDTIRIIVPAPTSPKQINNQSDDTRKLGIGLVKLKILEN